MNFNTSGQLFACANKGSVLNNNAPTSFFIALFLLLGVNTNTVRAGRLDQFIRSALNKTSV
tara:strand:- start:745 stop:927 length:183 start_codon:yes stop_codon:yes gene_type:complete